MSLILRDSSGLEEMQMMPGQQQMQEGGMPGQKDFNKIFKSEKENYEIINWKFKLDDAEDAFLMKYKK